MKNLGKSKNITQRPLYSSSFSNEEVNDAIESVLNGGSVCDIPSRLCQPVITTLTQKRKDALLLSQDKLAYKIEKILGELKYGPQRYQYATPGDPNKTRDLRIQRYPPIYNDDTSDESN